MFRQLLFVSTVLITVCSAQRPFPMDQKQAIADMEAAGIQHKYAEGLVKIEQLENEISAKLQANGSKEGLKKLQDLRKEHMARLQKAMPKDQYDKYMKFIA